MGVYQNVATKTITEAIKKSKFLQSQQAQQKLLQVAANIPNDSQVVNKTKQGLCQAASGVISLFELGNIQNLNENSYSYPLNELKREVKGKMQKWKDKEIKPVVEKFSRCVQKKKLQLITPQPVVQTRTQNFQSTSQDDNKYNLRTELLSGGQYGGPMSDHFTSIGSNYSNESGPYIVPQSEIRGGRPNSIVNCHESGNSTPEKSTSHHSQPICTQTSRKLFSDTEVECGSKTGSLASLNSMIGGHRTQYRHNIGTNVNNSNSLNVAQQEYPNHRKSTPAPQKYYPTQQQNQKQLKNGGLNNIEDTGTENSDNKKAPEKKGCGLFSCFVR